MYSGALIGTRIQGSGLSFLRPRKSRPIPQWNIQTVRGKVTGRCLWHACKALLAGVCLLMIGAAMATVGFVIVTACVMTFEARDSSAKIVPARFRNKLVIREGSSVTNNHPTLQLDVGEPWDNASTSLNAPGSDLDDADRHTLTHSFQQFSRYVQDSIDSGDYLTVPFSTLLKRSPSAPTLLTELHKQALWSCVAGGSANSDNRSLLGRPEGKRLQVNLLTRQAISVDNPREISRFRRDGMEGLQQNSNTHTDMDIDSSVPKTDSEASLTMDLHLPDCSITLTVKDESKHHGKHPHDPSRGGIPASGPLQVNNVSAAELGRRETSRRRPLLRQSQVELCDSDTESSPMES